MKKLNSNGFAHAGLLFLALIVIAVAGFAGWYVVNSNKDKQTPSRTVDNTSNKEDESKNYQFASSLSGTKYDLTSTGLGIGFSYPEAWGKSKDIANPKELSKMGSHLQSVSIHNDDLTVSVFKGDSLKLLNFFEYYASHKENGVTYSDEWLGRNSDGTIAKTSEYISPEKSTVGGYTTYETGEGDQGGGVTYKVVIVTNKDLIILLTKQNHGVLSTKPYDKKLIENNGLTVDYVKTSDEISSKLNDVIKSIREL